MPIRLLDRRRLPSPGSFTPTTDSCWLLLFTLNIRLVPHFNMLHKCRGVVLFICVGRLTASANDRHMTFNKYERHLQGMRWCGIEH